MVFQRIASKALFLLCSCIIALSAVDLRAEPAATHAALQPTHHQLPKQQTFFSRLAPIFKYSNWGTLHSKATQFIKTPTIMLTTCFSAFKLSTRSKFALLAFPLAVLLNGVLGFNFDKIRYVYLPKKIATTALDIAGPFIASYADPTLMQHIALMRFGANSLEIFSYLVAWLYWSYKQRHQPPTMVRTSATTQNLAKFDAILWSKTFKMLLFDTAINTVLVPWLSAKLPASSISSMWPFSHIKINFIPTILSSLSNFCFSYKEIKMLLKPTPAH